MIELIVTSERIEAHIDQATLNEVLNLYANITEVFLNALEKKRSEDVAGKMLHSAIDAVFAERDKVKEFRAKHGGGMPS